MHSIEGANGGEPAFRAFADAFDAGRFFDAHEALEELWQVYRGPDRVTMQGLIQAAVALEHHVRGNAGGAAGVGRRAARNLLHDGAVPRFGIDVAALSHALLDAVERGAAVPKLPRAAEHRDRPLERERRGRP